MFNFNEAEDDENLKKLEEQRKEKSAALHTTGIIMALCAGALYGIQSIIGKSLIRPLKRNYTGICPKTTTYNDSVYMAEDYKLDFNSLSEL